MQYHQRLDPTRASLVLMFLCAAPFLALAGPVPYNGQNTCTDVKPKICPYYETCCRLSEYCSDRSRACEPCFPPKISRQFKLNMCKTLGVYNVTWMSHKTCTLACLDIFSYEELYPLENDTSGNTSSENSFDKSGELKDCETRKQSLIVTLVILACVFILPTVCYFAVRTVSLHKNVFITSIHGKKTTSNCLQSIHCTLPQKHTIPIHDGRETNRKKSTHESFKSPNDGAQACCDDDTDQPRDSAHKLLSKVDRDSMNDDDTDQPRDSAQKLLSKVDRDSMNDDEAEDLTSVTQLSPTLSTRTREKLPVPRERVVKGDDPKHVHQKF